MSHGVLLVRLCFKPWCQSKALFWSRSRESHFSLLSTKPMSFPDRWYCEPAYEKWRGTQEGKVNRYAVIVIIPVYVPLNSSKSSLQ